MRRNAPQLATLTCCNPRNHMISVTTRNHNLSLAITAAVCPRDLCLAHIRFYAVLIDALRGAVHLISDHLQTSSASFFRFPKQEKEYLCRVKCINTTKIHLRVITVSQELSAAASAVSCCTSLQTSTRYHNMRNFIFSFKFLAFAIVLPSGRAWLLDPSCKSSNV